MPKRIFKKLQSNFIEIKLQQWCSPVNLLYIPKNTSGRLLLILYFTKLERVFNSFILKVGTSSNER